MPKKKVTRLVSLVNDADVSEGAGHQETMQWGVFPMRAPLSSLLARTHRQRRKTLCLSADRDESNTSLEAPHRADMTCSEPPPGTIPGNNIEERYDVIMIFFQESGQAPPFPSTVPWTSNSGREKLCIEDK